MRISAQIFKVKQPANSSHVIHFDYEGIPMKVGICIEDGELCGSGFVEVRKGVL